MTQFDWSKFSLKIYLNASMQQVYEAWATAAGLENWFLREAWFTMPDGTQRDGDSLIQKGDRYVWHWHGHPDTTEERGVVTAANGTDKFEFVFGNAGTVTVQLRQVGDATELLLTQHNIPADEHGKQSYHVGCSTGWTFYLANIKSVLEGGLDLRNKNMEYKGVINS